MKALNCLLICLTTLAFNSASVSNHPPDSANAPVLTNSTSIFPRTPKQLAPPSRSDGPTFNVIIPNEGADLQLPHSR